MMSIGPMKANFVFDVSGYQSCQIKYLDKRQGLVYHTDIMHDQVRSTQYTQPSVVRRRRRRRYFGVSGIHCHHSRIELGLEAGMLDWKRCSSRRLG